MDRKELIAAISSEKGSVTLPSANLHNIMKLLREDAECNFDMLLTHTAIDWLEKGQIELVYHLYSTELRHELKVFVTLPRDNPQVTSVSSIWRIAEFQEREVFDMFGVLYNDHPDLRRILLEDHWKGHPLRKDYKDDFMLERPE